MNSGNPDSEKNPQKPDPKEQEGSLNLAEDVLAWGTEESSVLVIDRVLTDISGDALQIPLPASLHHATVRVHLEVADQHKVIPPAHVGKTQNEIAAEIDKLWGAKKPAMTVLEIDRAVEKMRSEWDGRGWEDPLVQKMNSLIFQDSM